MVLTSDFNVAVVFDDDGGIVEEEGGEATDDDGDAPEEVRDGVLERNWLAAVGDWTVDLTVDLGIDESLARGDVNVLDLEVLFAVEGEEEGTDWLGVVFDTVWPFVERWETSDDDEDELTLIVDVGLIERLRDVNVDPRYDCCDPGTLGRGIKPKRVCIVTGGGGRFVIDIGLLAPKSLKIKITSIIKRKGREKKSKN